MRTERPVPRIPAEQSCAVIRRFTEELKYEVPYGFTDPFRYVPHPLVVRAASEVISSIDADNNLSAAFSEGKMLGVLVCRQTDGSLCYISAFSGNVSGRSTLEGFVPPIYDLTDPEGYFKTREAEISRLNSLIDKAESSEEHAALRKALSDCLTQMENTLGKMREDMASARARREEIRKGKPGSDVLERLVKESQFDKAEFRRTRQAWERRTEEIKASLRETEAKVDEMKRLRIRMSEDLQDWIFRQYIVHNAKGESKSIADIFADKGLIPPGGTGECAAPKLLEYAYRNGLRPVAMGEFWYGRSPDTAVRTHGHFYPSCTSKCGPLLEYMLRGETLMTEDVPEEDMITVYEDDTLIVVEKPSGMPSVPGLDGRKSLLERLNGMHPVHRLDMDTSGVMVFAKTEEAAVNLRKQFEEHSIRKTYMARISGDGPLEAAVGERDSAQTTPPTSWVPPPAARGVARSEQSPSLLQSSATGSIALPLSADYDERPRQKVDVRHGKQAYTEYEIVSTDPDGTAELLLYPLTGRTHQLRVHCAHHLGLGRPIVGDLLYGAYKASNRIETGHSRLCLHALSITFRHPSTGHTMTFSSDRLRYK